MSHIYIRGGRQLHGDVEISGMKNAALGIIPAALLANDVVILENVPHIADITNMVQILQDLQVRISYLDEHTLRIDSRGLQNQPLASEAVHKMRASYYLIGALLGRYGKAAVGYPGGCNFVQRPIDLHLKGFEALGAKVDVGDLIYAEADHLHGANIFLDIVSVGATINIMLAAVLADGETIINNAAKEPHVVDTANFLNSMGARVSGAGTDRIVIRGVESLHGVTYQIIPDQIEAGTYMTAAVITGGDITVRNIIPKHMSAITAKLVDLGATIQEFDDAIRVSVHGPLSELMIKTAPYPGFPTEMQPVFVAMLALVPGSSMVTENVWDNRFSYVNQLVKMGADIRVDGRVAVIKGVDKLTGCEIEATDLRAGAAMVLAGLAAEGVTAVDNVKYIFRGYESMIEKLRGLGADIWYDGDEQNQPVVVEGKIG